MGRRRLVTGLQSLFGRSCYFSTSRINPNNAHGRYGNYGFTKLSSRNDGRVFGKEISHEFASPRLLASQGLEMSTMAGSVDRFEFQSLSRPNSLTRAFWYEQRCGHTSGQNFEGAEKISVTFVDKDGEETKIQVPVGMSMLEAAHENDIELEGACEGSLACSTCHVIVMDEDMYNKLPEPSDEENDMLDLAFGLTETSRLGCQVIAKPELDGLHLALPAATRNFAVDGHVPKPH
ncbi:unnamed protein product [Calypogeia fissa]